MYKPAEPQSPITKPTGQIIARRATLGMVTLFCDFRAIDLETSEQRTLTTIIPTTNHIISKPHTAEASPT